MANDVDLAKGAAPQNDDDLLAEMLVRLSFARVEAEGNEALQLVVEGLTLGFLLDESPQAKAVIRRLVLGVDA